MITLVNGTSETPDVMIGPPGLMLVIGTTLVMVTGPGASEEELILLVSRGPPGLMDPLLVNVMIVVGGTTMPGAVGMLDKEATAAAAPVE